MHQHFKHAAKEIYDEINNIPFQCLCAFFFISRLKVENVFPSTFLLFDVICYDGCNLLIHSNPCYERYADVIRPLEATKT